MKTKAYNTCHTLKIGRNPSNLAKFWFDKISANLSIFVEKARFLVIFEIIV